MTRCRSTPGSIGSGVDQFGVDLAGAVLDEHEAVFGIAAHQPLDQSRIEHAVGLLDPIARGGHHHAHPPGVGSVRDPTHVPGGLQTVELNLPAVVTTDLRLNEPRFIKLPDIMKAKSKPIETLTLESLGVESGDHLKTTQYAPPAKRQKGVMVKDVPELIAAL